MSTSVSAILTPPQIAQEDYSIVQRPSLGGEMRVYLSNKPARKLGQLTVIAPLGGVQSVTASTPGTGYTEGEVISFSGSGGGSGAVGILHVDGSGIIQSVEITKTGAGYAGTVTVSPAPGTGSAAVFANAVIGPTLEYKFQSLPSSSTPGPILAVVKTELRADTDATVAYGGIGGTFSSALWAANKRHDFPAGKAVELVGTFTLPSTASIPTIVNAKRGSKVVLYELPTYADFDEAGVTNSKRMKWPVRGSKAIANQLETGEWIVPGKTEIGTLEMTSLSQGIDDGFQRYAGLKSTVMLVNKHEDKVERERIFCLNYTPNLDGNSADGDNEAQLTLNGMYEVGAVLVAPGT
jgi:hypothetical protein